MAGMKLRVVRCGDAASVAVDHGVASPPAAQVDRGRQEPSSLRGGSRGGGGGRREGGSDGVAPVGFRCLHCTQTFPTFPTPTRLQGRYNPTARPRLRSVTSVRVWVRDLPWDLRL